MMSELVKYCEKQYNPLLGCPTIRVGTLTDYREMDPSFSIADPNEQIERTTIVNYNSTTASQAAKNRLVGIQADETSQIVIRDSVHETVIPNSFVFCVSQSDSSTNHLEKAKTIEPTYDSHYKISSRHTFANKLATLIMEHFKLDWFDDSVRAQNFTLTELKDIRLNYLHRPVYYRDSKTEIIQNGRTSEITYPENIFERIAFTKDKTRINNDEYRFLFFFSHPDIGVLPVKKPPITLPISSFARVLTYP